MRPFAIPTYHDVAGDHPELSEYCKGVWVLYAQQLLQKAGYAPQDHKFDGLFGPITKEAVRDFQGANGLKVDGIIGPKTWAALEALASGQTAGAMSANLAAITTADGDYEVSVQLGDHFEFVDYKSWTARRRPSSTRAARRSAHSWASLATGPAAPTAGA